MPTIIMLLITCGQADAAPGLFSRLVSFFGQFHPMVTHFPLALTMVAAFAEAVALATGIKFFQGASRFNLILAALAGIGTATLGWAAAAGQGLMGVEFQLHRILGTAFAVVLIPTAYLAWTTREQHEGRSLWAYRIILAGLALTSGLVGFFGGELVFGPGHYHWL